MEGTVVRKRVEEDPDLYKIHENEVFDINTGEVKKVQKEEFDEEDLTFLPPPKKGKKAKRKTKRTD